MLRLSLALSLLLPCLPAAAHNTWLAPEAPSQAHKYWTVALSTGSAYPVQQDAPAESRISRADLVSSRRTLTLFAMKATEHALPFRLVSDDDPVQVAVATLKPVDIELKPDVVEIYLRDELGNDAAIRARFEARGHWRERYTKNAKALLRMRGDAPASVATKPHGLAYELVPSVDPTTLPAGTPFEVCAYANDQPVRASDAHVQIGLVDAQGHATSQPADAQGCATVAPATVDGYLLHSILLRPVDAEDIDWESHFAALTIARAAASPSVTRSQP